MIQGQIHEWVKSILNEAHYQQNNSNQLMHSNSEMFYMQQSIIMKEGSFIQKIHFGNSCVMPCTRNSRDVLYFDIDSYCQ